MKITKEEVENVALLARLELTEQETETFTGQMDAILAYVDKLNELNTRRYRAYCTCRSHGKCLPHGRDQGPPIGIENALANAPRRAESFFRVPKVIE